MEKIDMVELIAALGARINALEIDLRIKTYECEDLTKKLSEATEKLARVEGGRNEW